MHPHILASIITLLLIACIVAIVAEWFKITYTIALVLVGLIVAYLHITPEVFISHDVIFTLILPPLLFHGAMHMDLEQLKKNWKPISMLAVLGVVLSTLLIGFLLNQFWRIEFIYALLFGALITPTDPVSVLSILKKIGAPQRLRVILEGESVFNDGTGVVVFSIILGIISGAKSFHLGDTLLTFLKVTGGGTLIGGVVGFLAYKLLKKINDHLLEVAITVVLTFGTPLLAEHFHFSGIIAVVVAGLIIGNYGRMYSMSEKTRETLETFWEVIEFIINSLLFLIVGLELQVIRSQSMTFPWLYIVYGILAVLVSRLFVVYPIVWIKNKISSRDLPWSWSHVLFWGGLKGSISIALVVGLPPEFKYREFFLTAAFSVVLFTLVVQGLSMRTVIRSLKLNKNA